MRTCTKRAMITLCSLDTSRSWDYWGSCTAAGAISEDPSCTPHVRHWELSAEEDSSLFLYITKQLHQSLLTCCTRKLCTDVRMCQDLPRDYKRSPMNVLTCSSLEVGITFLRNSLLPNPSLSPTTTMVGTDGNFLRLRYFPGMLGATGT